MTDTGPMEPAEAFARLSAVKLSETDLDATLHLVAGLAKRAVPGAAEVSVTLVRGDDARTAAFTGDVARDLDESQYEKGYGPCLEAAASAITICVPRMSVERRWPGWARQSLTAGVGSSMSIGLPVQDAVTGALNLYATGADAFDDGAVSLGQTFAGYAAVALANAHHYDTTATLAEQLQAAMASRAVIEQAKGIIMGERRCTAEDAFGILAGLSQQTNRKLRDVAQALVDRAVRTPRQ